MLLPAAELHNSSRSPAEICAANSVLLGRISTRIVDSTALKITASFMEFDIGRKI